MAEALSQKVLARIDGAKVLYHRLILVTAPSGSGKTEALREVAESTGSRLVNLNLELSRRMLDLTERERALRLPDLLDDIVGRDEALVLLDNVEILFEAALNSTCATASMKSRLASSGTVPDAMNACTTSR